MSDPFRPHAPDALIQGGQTHRIITNHLGSPRLVVNIVNGTVVQRMDYDEFGRKILDTNAGAGSQVLSFAGGVYDGQTGLVRFGARDYDAEVGRWVGKDPILFRGQSFNLYSYTDAEPLNHTDPSGLRCINNSTSPMVVKPEDPLDPVVWLAPGRTYEGPIDGVRPPAWGGDWLKVWPGTDVLIQRDGTPQTFGWGQLYPSFMDIPGFTDRLPGRKNADWHERHPDWQPPEFGLPPDLSCPCSQ